MKIFLLLFAAKVSWAASFLNIHSAYRAPGESYSVARARYIERLAPMMDGVETLSSSAVSEETEFADLKWENVPIVSDVAKLFEHVRDERFLQTSERPQFLRRSSWLYPQDGCWIRASLINELADEFAAVHPQKLFIFGELSVKTKNAPEGEVSWWYHVASVVADRNHQVFILDPAIEPTHALPVQDWVLTMVPEVKKAKFGLCSPLTYMPSSMCDTTDPEESSTARADQLAYLGSEWSNLLEMHRNPEEELGEHPPWIH